MRVASFFAGVGGFELGALRAGAVPVWACELDPFARRVYEARFGRPVDAEDIQKVRAEDIPDAEVWTGGYPCQSVSVAGKREGVLEGTRTGLWWTWIRLIAEARPRYVLAENVPGLLTSRKGEDWLAIQRSCAEAGYVLDAEVLDARHHGVPQRRHRVIHVLVRADILLEGRHAARAMRRALAAEAILDSERGDEATLALKRLAFARSDWSLLGGDAWSSYWYVSPHGIARIVLDELTYAEKDAARECAGCPFCAAASAALEALRERVSQDPCGWGATSERKRVVKPTDLRPLGFATLGFFHGKPLKDTVTLGDILWRGEVPEKYFLSRKACEGILRRAKRRGRQLPPALEKALAGEAFIPDLSRALEAGDGGPSEAKQTLVGPLRSGIGKQGWALGGDEAALGHAILAPTVNAQWAYGSMGHNRDEAVIAAPLTAGGHPASSAPGRRREDDENLVVAHTLVAGGRETPPHGSLDGKNLVLGYRTSMDGTLIATGEVHAPLRSKPSVGGEFILANALRINHGVTDRGDGSDNLVIASPVTASAGHHGHSSPRGDGADTLIVQPIPFDLAQVTSPENRARCDPGAMNQPISATGQPMVAYAIQDASGKAKAQNGMGVKEGEAYTVDAQEIQGVCVPVPATFSGWRYDFRGWVHDLGGALAAWKSIHAEDRPRYVAPCFCSCGCWPDEVEGSRIHHDPECREGTVQGQHNDDAASMRLVRRLLPVETERLQAFPDGWVSKLPFVSDSGVYRVMGNAVCTFVAQYALERIVLAEAK